MGRQGMFTSPPPPTSSPSPNGRRGGGAAAGGGGGGEVKRFRLLSLLLLALGLANLGKALVAARYAGLLPDLPMTVPWGYLVAMGAFWGVVLSACGVALWLRRSWARWATLAAATLYQAHVWLNHFLFDASDYARQTRPRDLLFSLLFLVLIWGTLNWSKSWLCCENSPQRRRGRRGLH
ncbi:MAG TPA: hypothetical protein ENK08_05990 [Chloroflexi bacterium]|nr:hypothetical protein [Chloroflexota bacterium]